MKILMNTNFTPDLTHFLAKNRGAELNIGGAEALSKRYRTTPYGMMALAICLVAVRARFEVFRISAESDRHL